MRGSFLGLLPPFSSPSKSHFPSDFMSPEAFFIRIVILLLIITTIIALIFHY